MNTIERCIARLQGLFGDSRTAEKDERIEAARITSTRLKSLQRLRDQCPTTPDYKRESPLNEKAENDIFAPLPVNGRR